MIITMTMMIIIVILIIISIVILMEELREGIVRPRCLRKHYEHVLTIYYPPIYSTLQYNSAIVQWFNSAIVLTIYFPTLYSTMLCNSTMVQ